MLLVIIDTNIIIWYTCHNKVKKVLMYAHILISYQNNDFSNLYLAQLILNILLNTPT